MNKQASKINEAPMTEVHTTQAPLERTTQKVPRKRRARLIGAAATALAVGMTLAPVQASTALAYDGNSCSNISVDRRHDVDTWRADGGTVDFGDTLFGYRNGAPTRDAVLCWANDHKTIQIVGKLFNDGLAGTATLELRVWNLAGQEQPKTVWSLSGDGYQGSFENAASKDIRVSRYYSTGVSQVSVALYKTPTVGGVKTRVYIGNRYYGD